MTETIELLRRASAYIAASVKTDADGEPVTDSDHAAHDFACELAHAADRLAKTVDAEV
jgi:hypothetical protein